MKDIAASALLFWSALLAVIGAGGFLAVMRWLKGLSDDYADPPEGEQEHAAELLRLYGDKK